MEEEMMRIDNGVSRNLEQRVQTIYLKKYFAFKCLLYSSWNFFSLNEQILLKTT
jgi:hypothetical protein